MNVLGLFFTRGVSLQQWLESGLYDREVLIYHSHLESNFFSKMYWFTYGSDDAIVAKNLIEDGRLSCKIEVVGCPKWFLIFGRAKSLMYSVLMPIFIYAKASKCSVFKTNQMDGSLPAIICASICGLPLYVRTGYTFSRSIKEVSPKNWLRNALAYINEYVAFRVASISSVTSEFDRGYVEKIYGPKAASSLVIVGNYVNTNLFSPHNSIYKREDRILFVGRLGPQKNLDNAIIACGKTGIGLDIVGSGSELAQLKFIAKKYDANVNWLGIVQNNEMPMLLNKYRFFIIPSLWEGLPKALIEAMSVGMVCIGNNTTGINELIEDGVTGYLMSSPDSKGIADAINRALVGNSSKISQLSCDFIRSKYSLNAISKIEKKIFTKILLAHN